MVKWLLSKVDLDGRCKYSRTKLLEGQETSRLQGLYVSFFIQVQLEPLPYVQQSSQIFSPIVSIVSRFSLDCETFKQNLKENKHWIGQDKGDAEREGGI